MSRSDILKPLKGINGRRPGPFRRPAARLEPGLNAGRGLNWTNETDMFRNMGFEPPGSGSIRKSRQVLSDMNLALTVTDIGIIALEIIVIFVLIKCKRLSYQIKYFSINYLLANVIYNLMDCLYLLNGFIRYGNDTWVRLLGRNIMTFASCVSWCCMALLAVERILALKLSFKYHFVVTKRKVIATIAVIWIVNLTIFLGIFTITVLHCEGWNLSGCSARGANTFGSETSMAMVLRLSMVVYVTYSIIQLATFVKLQVIIKRHMQFIRQFKTKDVSASQKEKQKTSRFVLKLQLLHLVLHIPVIVYFISFELIFVNRYKTMTGRWIRAASQFSLVLHAFLTLVLYTWNLKECRLVFFNMFCFCCGWGRQKIEEMRGLVFRFQFPKEYNSKTDKQVKDPDPAIEETEQTTQNTNVPR